MTTLVESLRRPRRVVPAAVLDVAAIILGSLVVAASAQISIRLPFTPVPVTGQTFGVLLVGASLGGKRGAASLLLYLAEGAAGLPFFAAGASGAEALALSSPTAGYLWGFVLAAYAVGALAQRRWDRGLGSAIGAMLIGEIVVYSAGVPWLAAAYHVPAQRALALGLYPFVVGDTIKLLLAAGLLPSAWRLIGDAGSKAEPGGHNGTGSPS
jgi:biotin transport system substrate-specific component